MEHQVSEFLERLSNKSDDQAGAVRLFGRALSRSDRHVHLATRKGVIAVPIERIQNVRAPFSDDPSRVEITVRGGDALRTIRNGLRPRSPRAGGGADDPIIIVGPGVSTTVCSTTYTGEGDETMCDDEDCTTSADDLD